MALVCPNAFHVIQIPLLALVLLCVLRVVQETSFQETQNVNLAQRVPSLMLRVLTLVLHVTRVSIHWVERLYVMDVNLVNTHPPHRLHVSRVYQGHFLRHTMRRTVVYAHQGHSRCMAQQSAFCVMNHPSLRKVQANVLVVLMDLLHNQGLVLVHFALLDPMVVVERALFAMLGSTQVSTQQHVVSVHWGDTHRFQVQVNAPFVKLDFTRRTKALRHARNVPQDSTLTRVLRNARRVDMESTLMLQDHLHAYSVRVDISTIKQLKHFVLHVQRDTIPTKDHQTVQNVRPGVSLILKGHRSVHHAPKENTTLSTAHQYAHRVVKALVELRELPTRRCVPLVLKANLHLDQLVSPALREPTQGKKQ
mmetsp:Transcript_3719/g.14126  ORF Transcript_3719/g.14126 Transcript_3719/m.14126 type:complete len:364 (+) Transcript_3719:1537-2628(+)